MTTTTETIHPTPERLRMARDPEVTDNTGKVLKPANDNYITERSTGAKRMLDAPIERMHRAGSISNDQYQAASHYFCDYYNAGMAPLGAVDYGKVLVDGSKPSNVSDFRTSASERYRRSCIALEGPFRVAVEMIVLHEQGVEAVGRKIGINNAGQARAVGLDRLRCGLDILAVRYGIGRKR